MSNPPLPSQRPPLAVAVQEILGIPPAAPNGLPGLREAIAAQTDDDYERAKRRLVAELNAPLAPAQVADEVVRNVRVISVFRHLRDPARRSFGSYPPREKLVWEFLAEAADPNNPPGERKNRARAALLLAAQEGFYAGPAWLQRVVNHPGYDTVAEWPGERMRRLRERLAEERHQTRQLVATLKDAAGTLQALMNLPEPQLDPAMVDAFVAHLSRMLSLADGRLDFEWRVANLTWMLVNLANARQHPEVIATLRTAADGWRTTHPVPQFIVWLDEAFSIPWPVFKTPGVVFLTSEQVRQRRVDIQPPY